MSQIHLRLDLYGVTEHAQQVMRRLGIRYQIAVPQSLYDCWWFFNCADVPADLPDYLEVLAVDPVDCIGHGLSEADVESLKNGEPHQAKADALPIPSGGQVFRAGQIIPKRLKILFVSDEKGRHTFNFGTTVTVIGRDVYARPRNGEYLFMTLGKGRRMNNGTHKKITWTIKDTNFFML